MPSWQQGLPSLTCTKKPRKYSVVSLEEKERILLHLEAIKADCNALAMDVQKTLKLKDVVEEDTFASFSAPTEEEDEEE